ncbi:MAG TPA: M28 family peptidase [Bryobacteraceae bacterium]
MMRLLNFCIPALLVATLSSAQSLVQDLKTFVATPAVPGYESQLASEIQSRLSAYSPKKDNLGDVIVTIGSGAPHRLVVAPMDAPGYVVSGITKDGYFRLQRLPQFGRLPLFNELYAAEPVLVKTASGKWINGVVAGISVHLLPGRAHPPDPKDIVNMYVDVGASSAAQARGIDANLLSPVSLDGTLYEMGGGKWTASRIGDRFGDAALIEVLRHLDRSKLHGTLTVAFAVEQWTGARGLQRLLQSLHPDELIYVGRLLPGSKSSTKLPPGSGVLIGSQNPAAPLTGLAAHWKQIAEQNRIPLREDYSAPLIPPSYLPAPPLPPRTVHLAVASAWPSTPAEIIDSGDLADLAMLLEDDLEGSSEKPAIPATKALPPPPLPARPQTAPSPEQIVRILTQTYGMSGHETRVRETIERLLPPWAKPHTDSAGNLVLHVATPPANAKVPRVLFVAHMDEIGYQVTSILSDGHLLVKSMGGGLPYYYLGHVCMVHTAGGMRPGVMELPDRWNQPGFEWPHGRNLRYRVDIGARTAAEAQQLGVKVGDAITIPKKYRNLVGHRAAVRSFDDRVGDAALISAAWALGPALKNKDVTFLWSTEEELGLVGAGKAAQQLAKESKTPSYVFAIDTFVSADSPLESKRFADAHLGDGFVVRAIDNSNIVPRPLVAKVLRIAHTNHIPAQYGVTGGGNDGSAFLRYGSVDVALGWPLRYSHSPGEVIDARDLDALGRIVAAIAKSW